MLVTGAVLLVINASTLFSRTRNPKSFKNT
uniref:Uncharacterized protein n=1 Tax=Anguilla anguilla TaxID=7936 RepID=A0A0E9R7W5_ANGAN